MIEKARAIGRHTVKFHNELTGERWQEVYYNLITQGFWDAVFKFMNQSLSNPLADILNVTHLAIGDGTTAPAQTDTLLVNEIFRKPVSYKGFSPIKYSVETSLASAEANPTGEYIRELGVFCKATDDPDNGLLISRAVVNIFKTANISIIILWELTY